jgi:hypothetical protein
MARYNVSYSCSECGRLHPTKVFLTRREEFPARKTLTEVYGAEPLPAEVIRLFRYPALCPVTRNSVTISHGDRLYLVGSV